LQKGKGRRRKRKGEGRREKRKEEWQGKRRRVLEGAFSVVCEAVILGKADDSFSGPTLSSSSSSPLFPLLLLPFAMDEDRRASEPRRVFMVDGVQRRRVTAACLPCKKAHVACAPGK